MPDFKGGIMQYNDAVNLLEFVLELGKAFFAVVFLLMVLRAAREV